MKFAIIAAGKGARLLNEGAATPKPLIRINGECMIDRLIRIFADNGAEEVVVITNRLTNLVREHIRNNYDIATDGGMKTRTKPTIRLICKTTPSSMHSFSEVSRYLKDDRFCVTTVDTVFQEQEFKDYITAFRKSHDDGMMAVTEYIDDENPLYVKADDNSKITGFYDTNEGCKYVSGGIYCLTPKTLQTLRRCIEQGLSRMRNFQKQMVKDGFSLTAYLFTKIVDVDHVGDIAKAERFLSGR